MKSASVSKFHLVAVLLFAIVALSVASPTELPNSSREALQADRDGKGMAGTSGFAVAAEDQIFNDIGSSSSVSYSAVEAGLSSGSVDGGGIVDSDPLFVDPDGVDNIPGTLDDEIRIQNVSPVVNSGDDDAIPADRFDLDGDGDTIEPIPTDLRGAARTFPATGGGGGVDMGAYESGANVVSVRPNPDALELPLSFSVPYPNPVSDSAELSFQLPRTEAVELAIFDILGRERMVLFRDVAHKDRPYRVEFSVSTLASGAYFVRLRSASYKETAELVVVR